MITSKRLKIATFKSERLFQINKLPTEWSNELLCLAGNCLYYTPFFSTLYLTTGRDKQTLQMFCTFELYLILI